MIWLLLINSSCHQSILYCRIQRHVEESGIKVTSSSSCSSILMATIINHQILYDIRRDLAQFMAKLDLKHFKQHGSIEEYINKFNAITLDPLLSEEFKIYWFMRGLKAEISLVIEMMHPLTIQEAMYYARLQEELIEVNKIMNLQQTRMGNGKNNTEIESPLHQPSKNLYEVETVSINKHCEASNSIHHANVACSSKNLVEFSITQHANSYSPNISQEIISTFNGKDVEKWIKECEEIFILENIPDHSKVHRISSQLEGQALIWHCGYIFNKKDLSWCTYAEAVLTRFGDKYWRVIVELRKINHNGSVEEFVNAFRSITDNSNLNENYFISCFVEGLRSDIASVVKLQHPASLDDAVAMAEIQEWNCNYKAKQIFKRRSWVLRVTPKTLGIFNCDRDTAEIVSKGVDEGHLLHHVYGEDTLVAENKLHQKPLPKAACVFFAYNESSSRTSSKQTSQEAARIYMAKGWEEGISIENSHATSKPSGDQIINEISHSPIIWKDIDDTLESSIILVLIPSQQKLWIQDPLPSNSMQGNVILYEYEGYTTKYLEKQLLERGFKPKETSSSGVPVLNKKILQETFKQYSTIGALKQLSGEVSLTQRKVQLVVYLLQGLETQGNQNVLLMPSSSQVRKLPEFATFYTQAGIGEQIPCLVSWLPSYPSWTKDSLARKINTGKPTIVACLSMKESRQGLGNIVAGN